MRIRCPECGAEKGLIPFLWQATSPAGFRCTACAATLRLASPWLTALIGLVFGVLLSLAYAALLHLLGPADDVGGIVWRLAAIVPLAGAAMVLAHGLVLRTSGPRLATETASPFAYVLAAGGSMALSCALFVVAVSWVGGGLDA